MNKWLKIILMFSVITPSVHAANPETPPESVSLNNKMGTVTFTHPRHQELDCMSCHHTGNFEKCSLCHGVRPEAPVAKKMFHSLCKDCHTKSENAPVKCKDCHQK